MLIVVWYRGHAHGRWQPEARGQIKRGPTVFVADLVQLLDEPLLRLVGVLGDVVLQQHLTQSHFVTVRHLLVVAQMSVFVRNRGIKESSAMNPNCHPQARSE